MSTAMTVLREELGQQLGMMVLIPNGSFTSAAAASITSTDVLRNSNWGGGQFKGWIIFRPGAASSADFVRYAGILINSTGLLAHTGANYSDTTVGSEVVELWRPGARPDLELLASLNRVLEFEFLTEHFALSHIGGASDGDMALSTDTQWTDVGTTSTSAKATTAAVTPWGPRSYHTINNAVADSGTRSASYRVRGDGNGRVSMFTIAASEVGTSSLRPYNNPGTAVFADTAAVTSGEREPQLLAVQSANVPSGCELASLNLTNTSATGDTYWNQAWLYNHDDLTISLPSAVTEGFMAPKIVQARPRTTTGTNTYAAKSLDFIPLTEGVDYWLIIAHASAEPYKVRFAQRMPTTGGHPYAWPLFVEARIPQSALITLTAEADVVNVPKHNLLPRWKIDCLETIWNGAAAPKHPDWDNQMVLATKQLIQAHKARPIPSVTNTKPNWSPLLSAS